MNPTLQLKTHSGMKNRHNGVIPCYSINVVFMSPTAFEPRLVMQMDPSSTKATKIDVAASPSSRLASAPLMTAPSEMFRTALAEASHDTEIFEASMRALNLRRPADNSMPELKLAEFCVKLPEAKNVQLAADFTDWDAAPLDMVRFDDGVWSTTVPLPLGTYFYRFLVDGEWYDDQRAIRGAPNSRGAARAFVEIK